MTTTEREPVVVIGRDQVGVIAQSMGMRYYLTECCGASAKGGAEGTICRACYRPIDEALGGVPAQTGPVPIVFGDGLRYDAWKAAAAAVATRAYARDPELAAAAVVAIAQAQS